MNLLHELANMAADLLTLKEPFPEPYQPPEVTGVTEDWRGNPVIHIEADNYMDASDQVRGTTYPGANFRSVVHIADRHWEARVEPYRLSANEKPEETQAEYQQRIDKERW